MADRIAVLRAGAVQQVGAPREIYERPVNRWVAGFVGSPRMNLLPCRPEGAELVGEHGWTLPRPPWAQGESGRPLLLGVRAEDLSLERRDEAATLGGELYALEPLGDRTLVDVDLGGALIKVKARPSVTGTPGEPLRVAVDLDARAPLRRRDGRRARPLTG